MISRRFFIKAILPVALVGQRGTSPGSSIDDHQLLDVAVAGYRFHGGAGVEAILDAGQYVDLVREPCNAHDLNAIAIHHRSGRKLGYLPRRINSIPARLMDGGVLLLAQISKIEMSALPWKRVKVRVCMVRAVK